MIKKLNVRSWRLIHRIRAAIEFERCLKGLSSRKWFSFKRLRKGELFKLNSWIEYLAKHSQLNYVAAIDLYDRVTGLPCKLTRRRAARLTQLIIEASNVGVSRAAIDVGPLMASIEMNEIKKGAKK